MNSGDRIRQIRAEIEQLMVELAEVTSPAEATEWAGRLAERMRREIEEEQDER